MQRSVAKNIDEYILEFPAPVRKRLEKVRSTIRKAAPGAIEAISYAIPTFKFEGNLVHFAGFKNHIGFYPGSSGIEGFKDKLVDYSTSKGTVQFPHDKPLPLELIREIVKYRVLQTKEKGANKKARKTIKSQTTKESDDAVSLWMKKLPVTVRSEFDAVRKIIKAANPKLKERIKWNAPSYFYKKDIVTFGPYKKDKILLVFHHPAVVKVKSSLLEGDFKDRRLVTFRNKTEAQRNRRELLRIIGTIIVSIDSDN